jgi:hypothetical protein
MTDTPTKLQEMTEAEQKEILFAWWHKRPLQSWNGGEWLDRLTNIPPSADVAYRRKPEPRSGAAYVNVYPEGSAYIYSSRAESDSKASGDRIACVRMAWTEGQFDE